MKTANSAQVFGHEPMPEKEGKPYMTEYCRNLVADKVENPHQALQSLLYLYPVLYCAEPGLDVQIRGRRMRVYVLT